MISMSMSQAAAATNTVFHGDDVTFYGCSTDSRSLQRGNLFIALKGEHFDGHAYITAAEQRGASSLMLEHDVEQIAPALKVADTRKAMGLLARSWRTQMKIPVIAITGSNGKTTVKEMVAAILSELAEVHATHGNYNNEIGVPLTLFDLDKRHQYCVIEMGANHSGEIEWLSNITQPDVAVITQCAPAHLEGFGSIEGVVKAKAEIYSGLQTSGTAIINADDPYAAFWKDISKSKQQITFGLAADNADVFASCINLSGANNGVEFEINYQNEVVKIDLPLSGEHNVMNALAAAACCLSISVSLSVIKRGLKKLQPIKGRLQIKRGIKNVCIIDDTYNANPNSLDAALNVLRSYPNKRFLVLGDMGELGDQSVQLHEEAGVRARETGIDGLFTLGPLSQHAAEKFGQGAYHFDNHSDLNEALLQNLIKDVTVLVKGSRSMQMEQVVHFLEQESA